MKPQNLVVFLVGPTASGKSEIALTLARRINAEIISCDSMYIYKGMDIGTAKPSVQDRKTIPHHLIDIVSPRSNFSVHQYRRRAIAAMNVILKKKKNVLFVGGTGLYVKALLDGISQQPGPVLRIRQKLWQEVRQKGAYPLYQKLKRIDPECARRIHPNDAKRIIRALEVWQVSKRKLSDWENDTEGLDASFYTIRLLGLTWPRELLYRRVENRVDTMIHNGWLREVKRLKHKGLSKTARAAIGYRELLEFLAGKRTMDSAVNEIKLRTRHLVKKQMTWFRREERLKWIEIHDKRSFVARATREIINALTI